MPESVSAELIGGLLTVVIVVIAFVSSIWKITDSPKMHRKWNEQLQMPDSLRVPAAAFEFTAATLFLIPLTASIGAVALTAYLGAAIALHLRISTYPPALYAGCMITIIWTALHLR